MRQKQKHNASYINYTCLGIIINIIEQEHPQIKHENDIPRQVCVYYTKKEEKKWQNERYNMTCDSMRSVNSV